MCWNTYFFSVHSPTIFRTQFNPTPTSVACGVWRGIKLQLFAIVSSILTMLLLPREARHETGSEMQTFDTHASYDHNSPECRSRDIFYEFVMSSMPIACSSHFMRTPNFGHHSHRKIVCQCARAQFTAAQFLSMWGKRGRERGWETVPMRIAIILSTDADGNFRRING